MKQSITETLAAFLAGIEAKDLPPETTGKLRDCLIDYLGAVWFAANDPQGAGCGNESRNLPCHRGRFVY